MVKKRKITKTDVVRILDLPWVDFHVAVKGRGLIDLEEILKEEQAKPKHEQRASYLKRIIQRISRELTIELHRK